MENNKKINNVQNLENCPICNEKLIIYDNNIHCPNIYNTYLHFWEESFRAEPDYKYIGMRILGTNSVFGFVIICFNNESYLLSEREFQTNRNSRTTMKKIAKLEFQNLSLEEAYIKLKKASMVS